MLCKKLYLFLYANADAEISKWPLTSNEAARCKPAS